MQHVELLSRVPAGVEDQCLLTTGVLAVRFKEERPSARERAVGPRGGEKETHEANFVTSITMSSIMTHMSSRVLCLATSSALYDLLPSFLASGSPFFSTRSSGEEPATSVSPSLGSMPSLPPALDDCGFDDDDEDEEGWAWAWKDESSEPPVVSIVMREPGAMVILACNDERDDHQNHQSMCPLSRVREI